MPELPEVETIKNALLKGIGYSRILDVIVYQKHFREMLPDDFADRIVHADIISYQRIAKYIVIGLSNGNSIIWHLGMSGRIKISDQISEPLAKHDHVIIKTTGGVMVYNDARRFGLLTCCPTKDIGQFHLFCRMGQDPFSDKLTPAYLIERLHGRKTSVKEALLDQSLITGIGNIYASESLYEAKISPLREAGKLTEEECGVLIDAVRTVLRKAIEAGGSTLKDYHKPDGSEGYFQFMHCVYNKTGQRCPNCTCHPEAGGGIKKIIQAGRSSFYCPEKQK